MPFWKRTKKLFNNFKRQGSDRIKLPSTQQISRSQSDYTIDSLKLYDQQFGVLSRRCSNMDEDDNKMRPMSLFIESDEIELDEDRGIVKLNSSNSNCSTNNNTGSYFISNSQNSVKLNDDPEKEIKRKIQITQWSDFSISDLNNFLTILARENQNQRTLIIDKYRQLTKIVLMQMEKKLNITTATKHSSVSNNHRIRVE